MLRRFRYNGYSWTTLNFKAGEHNLDGFNLLRREFLERGWYQKATGRVLLELTFHLLLTIGGIALLIVSESLTGKVLGFLLSMLGSVGVATNTHTSTHYATSDKAWVNELLSYFGYPVFVQLSATYWWHKHCVLHHPAPNVIGVDEDTDLSPWFALTEPEFHQSTGFPRLYYKAQWVFLPLALLANVFHFQTVGWRYLFQMLRNPQQRRAHHWIDLGALGMHWILWVCLPVLFFPLSNVLWFNIVRIALMGIALFVILAPAHYPTEAVCLEKSQLPYSFALCQTAATVNFRTGYIGRLFVSGLEYQIEHHLFPKISHTYYPQMSAHVKEFCRKAGYPYRTLGWEEAIWKSCVVFWRPKQVQSRLNDLKII